MPSKLTAPVEIRVDLTGPAALREVRRAIDTICRGSLADLRDDAVVVGCELATNALEHGARSPVPYFTVRQGAGAVVLAAWDSGRYLDLHGVLNLTPVERSRKPFGEGGNGLLLVDRLADRWDVVKVDGRDAGKRVWATVALPG